MKLTERQLAVLAILIKVGDAWISQEDIYKCLEQMYTPPTNNFHNSTGRAISKDIQALKKHPGVEFVILSGTFGHKIATEEEARRYIKNKAKSLGMSFGRLRQLEKKASMDGQVILLSFEDAVKTVKAFVEGGN